MWSRAFLRQLPTLVTLLGKFVKSELLRYFVAEPEIRCPPCFRVHPPGWDSISPFHKDSEYGLSPEAINVWIPMTPVWDTNSLWIGTYGGGRNDLRPVCLRYGEALLFDAVNLLHGSKENQTDSTRVSFDFRCHGRLRVGTQPGGPPPAGDRLAAPKRAA